MTQAGVNDLLDVYAHRDRERLDEAALLIDAGSKAAVAAPTSSDASYAAVCTYVRLQ